MRKRAATGGTIAAFSIALLFWVGTHFDLFGQKVDFSHRPAFYLFYGSICLGIFGVLYIIVSPRLAAKLTVCASGIYLVIFLAGKLSRGEL